jgi:hypothetical protein
MGLTKSLIGRRRDVGWTLAMKCQVTRTLDTRIGRPRLKRPSRLEQANIRLAAQRRADSRNHWQHPTAWNFPGRSLNLRRGSQFGTRTLLGGATLRSARVMSFQDPHCRLASPPRIHPIGHAL